MSINFSSLNDAGAYYGMSLYSDSTERSQPKPRTDFVLPADLTTEQKGVAQKYYSDIKDTFRDLMAGNKAPGKTNVEISRAVTLAALQYDRDLKKNEPSLAGKAWELVVPKANAEPITLIILGGIALGMLVTGCTNNVEKGCTNGPGLTAGKTDRDPSINEVAPLGKPVTYVAHDLFSSCGSVQKDAKFFCEIGNDTVQGNFVPNGSSWDGQITYTFTKENDPAGRGFNCYLKHNEFEDRKDWLTIPFNTSGRFEGAPPAASIVPQNFTDQYNIKVNQSITLGATCLGCDPDTTYNWFFGDAQKDPSSDAPDAVGLNVTHAYSKPGNYNIILRAQNASGLYTDSNFMVGVTAAPSAFQPVQVTVYPGGEIDKCLTTVTFSFDPAKLRYTDGTVPADPANIELRWTAGAKDYYGTLADLTTLPVVFDQSGNQTIKLEARRTNDAAWSLLYSNSPYVTDKASIAPVNITAPSAPPQLGQAVSYSVTPRPNTDLTQLRWRWAFSDGTLYPADKSYTSERSVSHVWNAAGQATVTLEVIDALAVNDPACAADSNKIDYTQNIDYNYQCSPVPQFRSKSLTFKNTDGSPNIYECVTPTDLVIGGVRRQKYDPQTNACVDDPDVSALALKVSWNGNLDGTLAGADSYDMNSRFASIDPVSGNLKFDIQHYFQAGTSAVEARVIDTRSNQQSAKISIAYPDLPTIVQGKPNLSSTVVLNLQGGNQYTRKEGESYTVIPDQAIAGATYTYKVNGEEKKTVRNYDPTTDGDRSQLTLTDFLPTAKASLQVVVSLTVDLPVYSPEGQFCYTMRLDAKDLTIPVNPVNSSIAPASVIGPSVVNKGISAPFAVGNPDPKLTYTWNFGDSSDPVTGTSAAHPFGATGTYVVSVSAADPNNPSLTPVVTTWNVTVISSSSLTAPSIVAPSVVSKGANAPFAVGKPDPKLTYTWDFGDGSDPVTGASVTHPFGTTGTYVVSVSASDPNSPSAPPAVTTWNVTVISSSSLTAPSISAPLVVNKGVSAPFAVGNPDPKLTYSWNFGDNSPAVPGANVSHPFSGTGTYVATCSASDPNNPSAPPAVTTWNVTVISSSSLTAPSISAPLVVNKGVSAPFTVGNPDPNLNYSWNFGDNSPAVPGTSSLHAFSGTGTYVVTCSASDPANPSAAPAVTTWTVTVVTNSSLTAPSISAPLVTSQGVNAPFVVANANPDLNYAWDFGDGSPTVPGTSALHAFGGTGTYVVTASASDPNNPSAPPAVTSWTITVIAAAQAAAPSIESFGFSPSVCQTGESGKPNYCVSPVNLAFSLKATSSVGISYAVVNYGDNTSSADGTIYPTSMNGNEAVFIFSHPYTLVSGRATKYISFDLYDVNGNKTTVGTDNSLQFNIY